MAKTNNYPIVLVHGFLCWGSESKINQFFPCFGMWNGNAREAIMEEGVQCFTPHVGPFNSMWDRACILYAMIKGGRVDFGKAHSEKNGHARYGRTYPGYVKNWGELDEAGKIQKISIVGHSFGGPTVRTLIHLLAEGSAEERAATPAGELSPLFEGGKEKWIHSCTTLAATHNGVTLPDAGRPLVKPMATVLHTVGRMTSGTWFQKLYDFNMDQWGFVSRDTKGNKQAAKEAVRTLVNKTNDNIYWELSTEGAMESMKDYKTYDNIYYFSYGGKRTKTHGPIELPTKDMWLPLRLFSIFECFYKDPTHPKEWRPNDGLVNVPASKAPIGAPQTDFVSNEDSKPGVWNIMPLEWKDHTSYMAVGEDKETYHNYMKEIANRAMSLPVIE
ncbi:MAG: lipase [Oscillospiraceae bacterium]|nr:lipase [Oscillospiraceae bacterium]